MSILGIDLLFSIAKAEQKMSLCKPKIQDMIHKYHIHLEVKNLCHEQTLQTQSYTSKSNEVGITLKEKAPPFSAVSPFELRAASAT